MAKKKQSLLVPALITGALILFLTRKKDPPADPVKEFRPPPRYGQTTTSKQSTVKPGKGPDLTSAIMGQL